jgi:uncharacterized protein (TIGR00661 family)
VVRPRILIAPLDWGLGHATRCIPIIKELIYLDCEVYVAADKQILALLKKEFPHVVFLLLKGYKIKYSRNKNNFASTLFLQLPKITGAIVYEKFWVKNAVRKYKIDAVISDNRFGLYHRKIPCIYITHQLFIETGNYISSFLATKMHSFFIKKYAKCWVPDYEENGLAGRLSHPRRVLSNVSYIGPLSRLQLLPGVEPKYELFVSISGPEPQRTIFEKIVLKQLKNFKSSALVTRGLPAEEKEFIFDNKLVTISNHLSSPQMNLALQQSKQVICRSGYTTIMDLVNLKKSAVLVPTPGQKEQEYLAAFLCEKKYFNCVKQEDISLDKIAADIGKNVCQFPDRNEEIYKRVLNEFVLSLKTGNFAPQ